MSQVSFVFLKGNLTRLKLTVFHTPSGRNRMTQAWGTSGTYYPFFLWERCCRRALLWHFNCGTGAKGYLYVTASSVHVGSRKRRVTRVDCALATFEHVASISVPLTVANRVTSGTKKSAPGYCPVLPISFSLSPDMVRDLITNITFDWISEVVSGIWSAAILHNVISSFLIYL